MKKLYAFFAAMLISLSAFASADVVPSDAVLADYYDQGNVCMCFFVPADMACNDIVVTGSFNGWSSQPSACVAVEPVEGYDGWYVASFVPEAEPDAGKGIQAKPIMLDVDGNFNWDYQVGAATVIRGGVQIVAGYIGEIDLINYGTDAPNVFTVDAWKQNPCTAIYHNYKITVISDGCDGFVVPYLVGSMNSWTFQQMQIDPEATVANAAPTYSISFKAAEGTPYQIVSGLMDDQGIVPAEGDSAAGWKDIAYMQKLVDGVWGRIPGEDGDNQLTHEDANIVWDLRDEDLRWARCNESPLEYVVLWVNLPVENRPADVEIIGGFDSWEGTAMELLDNGCFFAEIEAKGEQYFKFRGAGSWDQEIEVYNAENDVWAPIGDGQLTFDQLWMDDSYKGTPCKSIELDLSDPYLFRWTGGEPYVPNPANCTINYIDMNEDLIDTEIISLNLPEAPEIDGFTFVKWTVLAGDLSEGITIQAVYEYIGDGANAPEIVVNPKNSAQKLIRNGNVYILHGDQTYTITGQVVK